MVMIYIIPVACYQDRYQSNSSLTDQMYIIHWEKIVKQHYGIICIGLPYDQMRIVSKRLAYLCTLSLTVSTDWLLWSGYILNLLLDVSLKENPKMLGMQILEVILNLQDAL